MIGIDLSGGFGNNLFQIANGAKIASDLGVEWATNGKPSRGAAGNYNGTEFEWNKIFKFDGRIDSNFVSNGLNRYVHSDMNPSHDFSFVPVPQIDNSYLCGYFQSPKYFDGFDVRSIFRFKEEKIQRAIKWKHEVLAFSGMKKLAAVHIRNGGDRVQASTQHYHKNVPWLFYERALGMLNTKDEYAILIVTDSDSVVDSFSGIHNEKSILISSKEMDYAFYQMAVSDRVILGNSTFSWWAAYLNESKEQHIAPKSYWFGPGYAHFKTDDLFPENWICL